AEFPKLPAIILVRRDERPGYCQAQRTGLAGAAATIQDGLDVKAAEGVGGRKRLLDHRYERRTREIVTQGATVHVPLARTGAQIDAADSLLAATNGVQGLGVSHYRASVELKVRGSGCCPTCGWSAPA